jgi:regulator of protease activity HflC (stomatin/prohibitin superfamily)
LQLPIKVTRSGYSDALTLSIEGLPGKLKAKPLTIAAGKNDSQLVIDVPAGTVLGEYSLMLRGEAKINYRRDEGGLRAANEFKAAIEKRAAEAKAKAPAASEAAKRQAEVDARALTAAQAAADKRIAAAMAAAKSKPETIVLYSSPARLKITAAPLPRSKPGAK